MKDLTPAVKTLFTGLWLLCALTLATPSPVSGANKPAQPSSGKQLPVKPANQQPLLFVRGKITIAYGSQKTGQAAAGIDVILLKNLPNGKSMNMDRKKTDGNGVYGFSIHPSEQGKPFLVKPWLDKSKAIYCPDRSSFEPARYAFTLSGSKIREYDFVLKLPPPDTSVELIHMIPYNSDPSNPEGGVSFYFKFHNKGCLPSSPALLNVNFMNPCSGTYSLQAPAVEPGGFNDHSTNVVNVPNKSAARGCPFSVILTPQPGELNTTDNHFTGTSPNLHLADLVASYENNLLYVRNKGEQDVCFKLKYFFECNQLDLQPADASSPAVPNTHGKGSGAYATGCLAPGAELKYYRPIIHCPHSSCNTQCYAHGFLSANYDSVTQEIEYGNNGASAPFIVVHP